MTKREKAREMATYSWQYGKIVDHLFETCQDGDISQLDLKRRVKGVLTGRYDDEATQGIIRIKMKFPEHFL